METLEPVSTTTAIQKPPIEEPARPRAAVSEPARVLPSQWLLGGFVLVAVIAGAYFLGSRRQPAPQSETSMSTVPHNEGGATDEVMTSHPDYDAPPAPAMVSPEDQRSQCQSNLRAIALAFKQYLEDYDEKFPPSSLSNFPPASAPYTPAYGWADALYPYTKSVTVFQCPTEPSASNPDPTQSGFTDYYYNSLLERHTLTQIPYSANTILAGEGESSNARYNQSYKSPSAATRHQGGANYTFVDGHVKWLKPEAVGGPNTDPTEKNYTHQAGISESVSPFRTSESSPTTQPVQPSSLPGERFAATRQRSLTGSEIQNWPAADVRYAVNEMYARHGYSFKKAEVRQQFQRFSWYHPDATRSQAQIEAIFTGIEKANLQLLSKRRSELSPGY